MTTCALLAGVAAEARADGPRLHAGAGAAHAVGNAQEREFGWGGRAAIGADLPVTRVVGIEAEASLTGLAEGSAPEDPTLARHAAGNVVTGLAGAVVRPFGGGAWLAAEGGAAFTGNLVRPALGARLGWDIPTASGRWSFGPAAGYTHVFQPDSALRPDDARIAWAGIQVSFDVAPRRAASSPPGGLEAAKAPPPVVVAAERHEEAAEEVTSQTSQVRLEGDRIAVDDRIPFAFDSDAIDPAALPVLERIARYIASNPRIVAVRVEGHADEVGEPKYNERLSLRRAEAVRRVLAAQLHDVALSAKGFGQTRPLARGHTEAERSQNRRVELMVETIADGRGPSGAEGR
jgi:outer membrane protein OmpA-like peptidoglycan-associated protein